MITQWQSGETIVGRLRVKGAKIDPALAQLRLSSLLNNALSHPTTLPASAIVFVRKLSDPLPRSLQIQHSHVRPPSAWQQALNRKLESLIANAARPALGLVPANAQAVVFLDRSELLAALATDWCEGRIASRWWWQSLLKRATASQLVKGFWQSAPEYVPAALDNLERAGRAVTFVETFSDSDSPALLIAVSRTFALTDLVSVVDKLPVRHKLSASNNQAVAGSPVSPKKANAEDVWLNAVPSKAPWDDFLQTTETRNLAPEQQRLLGVAIMLQRAPATVRTKSFAQAVEAWSREIIQVATKPVAASQHKKKYDESVWHRQTVSELSTEGSEKTSSTQLELDVSSAEKFSPELPCTSLFSKPFTAETDIAPREVRDVIVGRSESEPAETEQLNSSSQLQLLPTAESNVVTSPGGRDDTNNDLASSLTTAVAAPVSVDESAVVDLQTETEFGGLFYLINLGIYLGFYGDFTTPAEPGIDLNIWDFVALVGRELEGKRIEADPLWSVLRDLAGRAEGDEPGNGFDPPNAWRVPPEWLKPFSGGMAHWWTTGGRLLLRHPAGFQMLDVATTAAEPDEQLQRELKAYGQFKSSISLVRSNRKPRSKTHTVKRHSSKMRPKLRRWLDLLLPYVRARLQRALGLNEEQNPASILWRQRAQLSVTATHIDVYMALSALPIEIRMAGLDRNPGWVPAAGRFITFHFE